MPQIVKRWVIKVGAALSRDGRLMERDAAHRLNIGTDEYVPGPGVLVQANKPNGPYIRRIVGNADSDTATDHAIVIRETLW